MSCQGSSQVTDFASLAFALARFGKVGREATNQKVGSSSPPGRTTLLDSIPFIQHLIKPHYGCNWVQLPAFHSEFAPEGQTQAQRFPRRPCETTRPLSLWNSRPSLTVCVTNPET